MIRAAFCLFIALVPALTQAMDPAQAYAAIPHRRTPYDAARSPLPPTQSDSLARLFALTDQGVVLRVRAMQAQAARDAVGIEGVLRSYDRLAGELEAASFEGDVARARTLVADAVRAQRRFLAARPQGGMTFVRADLVRAPEVSGASRSLHGAYDLLMRSFAREEGRNKTAFYDHLCALDFL